MVEQENMSVATMVSVLMEKHDEYQVLVREAEAIAEELRGLLATLKGRGVSINLEGFEDLSNTVVPSVTPAIPTHAPEVETAQEATADTTPSQEGEDLSELPQPEVDTEVVDSRSAAQVHSEALFDPVGVGPETWGPIGSKWEKALMAGFGKAGEQVVINDGQPWTFGL